MTHIFSSKEEICLKENCHSKDFIDIIKNICINDIFYASKKYIKTDFNALIDENNKEFEYERNNRWHH